MAETYEALQRCTGGRKYEVLLQLALRCASIDGIVAECGVYMGGTLAGIAAMLPHKRVLGFDTFEGLPPERVHPDFDRGLHGGEFNGGTIEQVRLSLEGFDNIELVPGIFPDSAAPYAKERFAFVYLDMDLYGPTLDAINWFRTRMSQGGIILFDDWKWEHTPGVTRAIVEAALPVERVTEHQVAWLCE